MNWTASKASGRTSLPPSELRVLLQRREVVIDRLCQTRPRDLDGRVPCELAHVVLGMIEPGIELHRAAQCALAGDDIWRQFTSGNRLLGFGQQRAGADLIDVASHRFVEIGVEQTRRP